MKLKKMLALFLSVIMALSVVAPLSAFAGEAGRLPVISIKSVNDTAGAVVDVTVEITNNTGILGATLGFTYDSGLTLLNATEGEAFSALTMTKPGKFVSPCRFVWDGQEITQKDIKDGTILTLQFKIDENAKSGDEYSISMSYKKGDILDADLNSIDVKLVNGSVGVVDFLPGDLDGDGIVNTRDIVLLRRDIAGGYEQTINATAGDVDNNGERNTRDIILVRRYVAGGYGVELVPSKPQCEHSMTNIPYVAPTATKEGNISYWYCAKCNKYFSDEAASTEIDIEDTIIPKLSGSYHTISYDISNGDSYIAKQDIQNPNPSLYYENEGLTLKNLSLPGYRFLGWYDGAGTNSVQIKKITADMKDDFELYAHWEKIVYSIQLKSDIFIDTDKLSYTVDTGVALPTPKLSNYIFTGWSDEDGNLYRNTIIPAGTTGNMYLTANWTSERNKTWTKKTLDAPIIVEDDENILFAYEIGQIQNVPLYTIKDFGYISGDGVTKTATEKYSFTTDEKLMNAYSKTTANATTDSSSWTLSSSWNDVTSVNEQWAKENGKNIGEVDTVAKNSESNWNVSSGRSGSSETSTITTNNEGWENQVQLNGSKEHTEFENSAWNVNGKLTYTPKSYSLGIGFEGASVDASTSGGFGFEVGGGYEHKWGSEDKTKYGFELSGKQNASSSSTESATETSSWNSNSSYGGSNSASQSKSSSVNLSEKISQAYGYGHEYAKGEEQSQQQGHTSTQSYEDGYSSSVTYSLSTQEEKTNTWTTQATKPGYHRWIVAGTAHVFGVVGYNMLTKSYYVYTYSVMDDETHEFEDYSYTSAMYNDNENGVIPFEIPYDVAEYVSKRTCASEGLKVNLDTGIVTEYTGTDTYVVIPEYFNTGTGDIVKITGIDANAFKGNTNIEAVELSDFITEIPNRAFEGCTSLIGVSGENITKIGDEAFSGCISAKECGVSQQITYLGENAFKDVGGVIVNAANADVVKAAANSGAKEIVISLEYIKDDASLENTEINIPQGTKYFELNGKKDYNYKNLSIESNADTTVLNKINTDCNGKIPFKTSSSEVVLNQSSAQSNGLVAVFLAENVRVGLQGTVSFVSGNDVSMLCKQMELYEANNKVVGNLSVVKSALACAEIINQELMTGDVTLIDNGQFENYLNSRKITFNANGGNVATEFILVPYNGKFGELPIASRDYYSFDGWYTAADGGEKITEDSIMTSLTDITLYAHWNHNIPSPWVSVSDLPAGAEVVNRKYGYTQTYYTTSNSSSLSGWNQYNSTSAWSDWGGWSGWQDGYIASSDSRDVGTQSVVTGYNKKTQWIYHRFVGYKNGWYVCPYSSGICTTYEDTGWLDYSLPWEKTSYFGGKGYSSFNPNWSDRAIADGLASKNLNWYYEETRVVDDYNSPIYKTQYRYRDRYLIYTYYYSRSEYKESTSYPYGDNISNIQEYVQYRAK